MVKDGRMIVNQALRRDETVRLFKSTDGNQFFFSPWMSPALAPVSMENTHPSRCNQLVSNLDQAGPGFKIGPPTLKIEK